MITSLWKTAQVVDKSDPDWRPNYVPTVSKPGKKKSKTSKVTKDGEVVHEEEHDEEAPEHHEESEAPAVSNAPAAEEEKKEEAKGGGWGMGGGMGMGLTQKKQEDDGPLDDPEDQVYIPLDCVEIGEYKTTYELEENLVERDFKTQEVTDYVTLGDVAAEMEELRQEKEDFEEIAGSIKSELDALARETIMKRNGEKLTAAKIYQIQKRLKEDDSLQPSDDEKSGSKYPFELPDNAAGKVKKNLAKTYQKILKNTWDMDHLHKRELEERYNLLRR